MKIFLSLLLGCAFSSCCVPGASFSYFTIYNGTDKSAQLNMLTSGKKYLDDKQETKLDVKLASNSILSYKTPISSKCFFSEKTHDIENFTLNGCIYKNHGIMSAPDGIVFYNYIFNDDGLYYVSVNYGDRSKRNYELFYSVSTNEKYDEYMKNLYKKIKSKYGVRSNLDGKVVDGFRLVKIEGEKQ